MSIRFSAYLPRECTVQILLEVKCATKSLGRDSLRGESLGDMAGNLVYVDIYSLIVV